jgi:hypothetical protein
MCLYGGLETLNKAVSFEWLRQVANRAGCQRMGAGFLVRECGEENERNAVILATQVILQLDAAHARHLNVRHDTGEIIEPIGPQKLLGRRECMHDISKRPHEAIGRGAYGFFIVDDCDNWQL